MFPTKTPTRSNSATLRLPDASEFRIKDLVLTPADHGVLLWELDGYKRFYNTQDHHLVHAFGSTRGVTPDAELALDAAERSDGVNRFHPFKDHKTFVQEFVKRIKKKKR